MVAAPGDRRAAAAGLAARGEAVEERGSDEAEAPRAPQGRVGLVLGVVEGSLGTTPPPSESTATNSDTVRVPTPAPRAATSAATEWK